MTTPAAGTLVKAKRAGWDVPEEGVVTEQDVLYPPAWRDDDEDEDVEGEVEYVHATPDDGRPPYTVTLVNGYEVDPATVELVE